MDLSYDERLKYSISTSYKTTPVHPERYFGLGVANSRVIYATLLRAILDDGCNNLLRALSHDDSMAPLRSRDASCRQSFMNVRATLFSHIDVSASTKA